MIDKPRGRTSHDVVNKLRRLLRERSIGHLGTLDPLATGVLPLLIGPATRLAKFHTDAEKVYEARVCFGFATDTYDSEGTPAAAPVSVSLDPAIVESLLAPFHGPIQQTPPRFSAKKIGGTPAYKLARQNKAVDLAPVDVEVFSLQVLEIATDSVLLRIRCSSGFYVRSLAHDLGGALGCGAHLCDLRRTRSGPFVIEQAVTLEDLESRSAADLDNAVIPGRDLLPDIPRVTVDDTTAARIRLGRNFHTSPFLTPSEAPLVKAVGERGELVAVAEAVLPNLYHPAVVMP